MIIFIKFMLCIVSAHVYMSTCRGMPMSERIVTPLFGIAMPFCRDYDRVEFLQAVFVSIVKIAYVAMPILDVTVFGTGRVNCLNILHVCVSTCLIIGHARNECDHPQRDNQRDYHYLRKTFLHNFTFDS